jgi:hypothetical protein
MSDGNRSNSDVTPHCRGVGPHAGKIRDRCNCGCRLPRASHD